MKTPLVIAILWLISFSSFSQAPIPGWVDMHAHPRGDLAYGTELYFGVPYGDIEVAMGNCKGHHGAWGVGNTQGNLFRKVLVQQTEQQFCKEWEHGRHGFPDFKTWPSWYSVLHQQMWVDWVERAHDNGLNVMVALAVSSHTIASAGKTKGPQDDRTVMYNLIKGIKDWVAASDFMEIAYTPQEVRKIVERGNLAVILGSEMDNIGNFYAPQDGYPGQFNAEPTIEQLQAELDTMWAYGIRYIFPVHLNNTVFGGTALAMSPLNVANKFVTGAEYLPEEVPAESTGIAFRLEHPSKDLNAIAKLFMPALLPKNVNPGKEENYTDWGAHEGFGQRNSLGLTDLGRQGIAYLMDKGYMIDIDHMSEKMADEVLDMAIARKYPVCSGHGCLRGSEGAEGDHTAAQYAKISQVGGMIALNHGLSASDFLRMFREVSPLIGDGPIAMGTDVGGFSPLPAPDPTVSIPYSPDFVRCSTGNRTWDFNVDGVAHYGLWPDYIRSWTAAGMTEKEMGQFMQSAEGFVKMWELITRK